MVEHKIRSDVAGRVWQVLKGVGNSVKADEPVVIIEAMKMEIPVVSGTDGQVLSILVREGDEVADDQVIFAIESGA